MCFLPKWLLFDITAWRSINSYFLTTTPDKFKSAKDALVMGVQIPATLGQTEPAPVCGKAHYFQLHTRSELLICFWFLRDGINRRTKRPVDAIWQTNNPSEQ